MSGESRTEVLQIRVFLISCGSCSAMPEHGRALSERMLRDIAADRGNVPSVPCAARLPVEAVTYIPAIHGTSIQSRSSGSKSCSARMSERRSEPPAGTGPPRAGARRGHPGGQHPSQLSRPMHRCAPQRPDNHSRGPCAREGRRDGLVPTRHRPSSYSLRTASPWRKMSTRAAGSAWRTTHATSGITSCAMRALTNSS